jgi:hypothetical protein
LHASISSSDQSGSWQAPSGRSLTLAYRSFRASTQRASRSAVAILPRPQFESHKFQAVDARETSRGQKIRCDRRFAADERRNLRNRAKSSSPFAPTKGRGKDSRPLFPSPFPRKQWAGAVPGCGDGSPTVRATPVVELQREYRFERISISFAWQILA